MQRKERMKTGKRKVYRKKRSGRGGERKGIRALPGIAAAGLMMLVSVSAVSYMMDRGVLPVTCAALSGKLCFASASLIGSWIAARASGGRRLLGAGIPGALLLLATAICFALINDTGGMRLIVPFAIMIGTTLVGGALGARKKRFGYV